MLSTRSLFFASPRVSSFFHDCAEHDLDPPRTISYFLSDSF